MQKVKILHLFPTPNVYGLLSDSYKPDIVLDEKEEGIIGIWKAHWANQMCDEILKINNNFEFEIWQPDHRAKKVYRHNFDNGLVHVIFPFGSSVQNPEHQYNRAKILPILQYLSSLETKPIIQLHEFGNFITQDFLEMINEKYKILLLQYGGFTYKEQSRQGKNILKRFKSYKKSYWERSILKKVNLAIVMNQHSKNQLEKVYNGPIYFNNMGIDFNFWQNGLRDKIRAEMQIDHSKKIILSASMLRGKKQIDLLIKAFILIEKDDESLDYQLLIVGGGDSNYEKILLKLSEPLIKKEKIKFLGRISDEELLKFYQITDLFILVSSGEGSPVGAMKAHACNVPVLTTNFGQAPEILNKYKCGFVVNNNFKEWVTPLKDFIKGNLVITPLNYDVAFELYDWKNVSQNFLNFYKLV